MFRILQSEMAKKKLIIIKLQNSDFWILSHISHFQFLFPPLKIYNLFVSNEAPVFSFDSYIMQKD